MTAHRILGVVVLCALAASPARAQDDKQQPPAPAPAPEAPRGPAPPHPLDLGPPSPPPTLAERQVMWPAATSEGWAKPVLVKFQRSWDDALAVSKETKKPILVCINMDGEIASEHYAGVRYREAEIAKLYEPYVCVVASVYRHTPRDYDDQGHRILCPRFGSVTCGEHIAIEPVLFEKFMEGKRVSPRHIMVGLDQKPLFDVYFINDTEHVFQAIREGIKGHEGSPSVVKGDRPIADRVASRDLDDRDAVESAYAAGDAETRKKLLEAALAHPEAAPTELLRQAVFGFDLDLGKLARQALAKTDSPSAVNLIADALRVPMDDAERDTLIATLARLGESSVKARWLAAVHSGLAAGSASVDVKGWSKAGGEYKAAPEPSDVVLAATRDVRSKEARARPEDPAAKIGFAEASLALAMDARKTSAGSAKDAQMVARLLFDDARAAAEQAQKLGADAWRADSVLTLASYYAGDVDAAYARAEAAVKEIPAGDASWNTMAVFTIFAESRWKAIKAAVREKKTYTPQALADLNAANTVLMRHPLGTAAQALWHYDFLEWLGATTQAWRFLDDCVARFPESSELHVRYRRRVLTEKGIDALEPAYEALAKSKPDSADIASYAGRASVIAGDFKRRKGSAADAIVAYGNAVAHYERAIELDPRPRAMWDETIALVAASKARVELEKGDLEHAVADLVTSFERHPAAVATRDSVGITPAETLAALRAKLVEAKRDDLVTKLDAAAAKVDPSLLLPRNEE